MSGLRLNDIEVCHWLNTDKIDVLAPGKVVALHAFQMLCPGCVLHGIPQSQRLYKIFDEEHVSIIGLHTVFEHHEAMRENSLKAFLYEFRVQFPVGIDTPSEKTVPKTMQKFGIRGTPTWLIFNRKGELKFHHFGQVEDTILGVEIAKLVFDETSLDINIYKK